MKTRLRLVCFNLMLFWFLGTGTSFGQGAGGIIGDPGSMQPLMTGIVPVSIPGRVWIETNLADNGLGYSGSYATLGGKTNLFQDYFDGRWLLEGQGHVSMESGGMFLNLGIERVFTVAPAGADVSFGFWFDWDDDQQGTFGHSFTQLGVSGGVETQCWGIYGNGYFPVGTSNYALGDPTGQNCFLNNSIVIQAGIDSALQGFDAMVQFRPTSMGNTTIDFGGYGYGSELVEFFGGVRARAGVQLMRGLIINGEINHDDRFDWTGVLQLAILFGANARGNDYGFVGRDLDPTIRNDHIVRYQRDLVLAIDPDTGAPYNVWHVNNTADPAFADGTIQTPFRFLKSAEVASGPDDIIFVHRGDGTTFAMNQGIILKDGQMLLGDGVRHVIPLPNNRFFVLCNNRDGNVPRITNVAGAAVTLASRNTVRGFIIDGSNANMSFGILGIGAPANPRRGGVIGDVTIVGGPLLDGIRLFNVAGNWRFERNNISTAGADGIHIENALSPSSQFEFEDNIVSGNGRDGINFTNYDGREFLFVRNTTNGNGRHGVRMQGFVNGSGLGGEYDFIGPISQGNGSDGLSFFSADGDLRIVNANITGNSANGINLVNFTNSIPGDGTFIGTTLGGVSNISSNGIGAGANIAINQQVVGGFQTVMITNSTMDNGGMGVFARASGVGTLLLTNVVNNGSVSGNLSDGMRFISETGATQIVRVENTGAALVMANNGNGAGSGIVFLAGDMNGGTVSSINGTVRNVAISGTGSAPVDSGIFGDVRDDGQMTLLLENSTINGGAGDSMHFNAFTSPNLVLNSVTIDNVTATGAADDGLEINTGPDTFFAASVTNSTFTGGAGNGLELTADGDELFAPVDNRTQLFVQNTTFSGFGGDGMNLLVSGDAHLLTQFDGLTVTGNGDNGIDLDAIEDAVVNTQWTNSAIAGNTNPGVDIDTTDNGIINALLVVNNITGNDSAGTTADMTVDNAPLGSICLSMSNNFFQLPAILTNTGAPAAFVVELDGATNGVGIPTFVPNIAAFTISPFGSTCEPAINAEELAFIAAGFPPLP